MNKSPFLVQIHKFWRKWCDSTFRMSIAVEWYHNYFERYFYNFKSLGEEHYYFSSPHPPEIVPDNELQNSNKSHSSTAEQLTLSVASKAKFFSRSPECENVNILKD